MTWFKDNPFRSINPIWEQIINNLKEGVAEAKASGGTAINVQEYIVNAGGKVVEGFQNAITAAEAAGGGVVQLSANVNIPAGTTRGTVLSIKSSNVIIDLNGFEINNAATSTGAHESAQERLFEILGTEGTTTALNADAKEGDFKVKTASAVQPADGLTVWISSKREFDVEQNKVPYGELVIAGVPDGALGGDNGAITGGIKVSDTVTELTTSFVPFPEWPASGKLKIDSEEFVYTSVVQTVGTGLATFTITSKVATATHKEGARVTLVPATGEVWFRTAITAEGALANATNYTEGVAYAEADAAQITMLNVVENVIIRNGKLTGAGPGQVQVGIWADKFKNVKIENLFIKDFEHRLTNFVRGSRVKVKDCQTEHAKYTNLNSGLLGYGISLSGPCQDVVVDGLRHSSGRHGVTSDGATTFPSGQVRRVTIRDSYFHGTGAASIDAHGAGVDYIVQNCHLIDGKGISINGPSAVITGNRLIKSGIIFAENRSKGSTNYVIADNDFIVGTAQVTSGEGIAPTVKTTATKTDAILSSTEAVMKTLEVGMPIVSAAAEIEAGTTIAAIVSVSTKEITLSKAAGKTEAAAACTVLRGGYNFRSIGIDNNNFYKPTEALQVKTRGEGNTDTCRMGSVSVTNNKFYEFNQAGNQPLLVDSSNNPVIAGNVLNGVRKELVAITLRDSTNGVIANNTINYASKGTGIAIEVKAGTGAPTAYSQGHQISGNSINSAETGIKLDNATVKTGIGVNTYTNTTTPISLGSGEGNFTTNENATIADPAETTASNTAKIKEILKTLKEAHVIK